MNLPDLTVWEIGGLTLPLAAYLVLQALKRTYPPLARWIPLLVLGLAGVLVATLLWYTPAFQWLAGTLVASALIIGAHGAVKNVATDKQEPPGQQ